MSWRGHRANCIYLRFHSCFALSQFLDSGLEGLDLLLVCIALVYHFSHLCLHAC